ncbi:MAG: hypothetical protein RMK57_16990, partial [Bryobacterales bacterium]|nr:hypothetical protein [Bryobacterales bacterium]
MPEAAFVDVDAGRILLRTPFSNLLLCKRIPSASWDRLRRLWTYPATPQHARLIRASIPRLEASDRFAELLAAKTVTPVPPVKAPEPTPSIGLPAGLKTTPWRHQIEAFRFAMERLLRGAGAALLALEMGVGKTLVALMVLAAMAARRVLICCPLRVYRDLEEDFVAEVREARVTAANAMVKLLRLQQVASGWVKTDEGQYHRVDSAKQNLLADTLEDIGANEPV